LTLSNQEVVELLDRYEKDSRAIKEEALRLSWHMRGGLNYEDAMLLSQEEREIIAQIIKENMKTTKDTGLPYF
jgi:hypothetical protein